MENKECLKVEDQKTKIEEEIIELEFTQCSANVISNYSWC